MNKSYFKLISIITVILFALSISIYAEQQATEKKVTEKVTTGQKVPLKTETKKETTTVKTTKKAKTEEKVKPKKEVKKEEKPPSDPLEYFNWYFKKVSYKGVIQSAGKKMVILETPKAGSQFLREGDMIKDTDYVLYKVGNDYLIFKKKTIPEGYTAKDFEFKLSLKPAKKEKKVEKKQKTEKTEKK